jgi:hypothetical protein
MRYNEYYGSAYNFEVGYLEALRTVSRLLAAAVDLETAQNLLNELIVTQKEETRQQIPEED